MSGDVACTVFIPHDSLLPGCPVTVIVLYSYTQLRLPTNRDCHSTVFIHMTIPTTGGLQFVLYSYTQLYTTGDYPCTVFIPHDYLILPVTTIVLYSYKPLPTTSNYYLYCIFIVFIHQMNTVTSILLYPYSVEYCW